MFKNILMPTDGSEHSERAIERGVELAKLCGAKVTGIHVVTDYRMMMAFADGVDPDPPVMQVKIEEDERARAASFLVLQAGFRGLHGVQIDRRFPMCHKLDDDLEIDLVLAALLRFGEQEADELTQSFGTPIPNCEPGKNHKANHATVEQAGVVPVWHGNR